MTGRHPVPRPQPRHLPPPRRFRRTSRWKSALTLAVLLVVIVLACVGSVELSKLNINISVFGPFAPPPVATQTANPSASPTTSAHK